MSALAVGAVTAPAPTTAATGAGTGALLREAPSTGPENRPVAEQLGTALLPVAHQSDGSYQVNIRLQPEELGTVHVELHLEAGTVNVSLHADGDATRDMLRQNLGELRQQMTDSGLSTGHFDVGTGPGTGQEGQRSGLSATAFGDEPETALAGGNGSTSDHGTPTAASADGLLDVRL